MTMISNMTELADFLQMADLPDAIININSVTVPGAPSTISYDTTSLAREARAIFNSASVRKHSIDTKLSTGDGEIKIDLEANGQFVSETKKSRLRWMGLASSKHPEVVAVRVRPVPMSVNETAQGA